MTTDRARRVAGVVLVAIAVAVGGCGNSEKDQYKQDAKAIIEPLRSTLNSTNERVAAAHSLKGRIAALDTTRRALDTAATKLGKLDPPADAKAAHENFIRELQKLAADIRGYARAANGTNPAAVRRALDAMRSDTAGLQAAITALRDKVDE